MLCNFMQDMFYLFCFLCKCLFINFPMFNVQCVDYRITNFVSFVFKYRGRLTDCLFIYSVCASVFSVSPTGMFSQISKCHHNLRQYSYD